MGTKNGTVSPKSDSKKTGSGKEKVAWRGYINYNLNDELKRDFDQIISSGKDPLSKLEELVQDGISLKHSYDAYHSAYVATLYDGNSESPFAGYALTARGKDCFIAARRVLYIHFWICDGSWAVIVNTELPDDAW